MSAADCYILILILPSAFVFLHSSHYSFRVRLLCNPLNREAGTYMKGKQTDIMNCDRQQYD